MKTGLSAAVIKKTFLVLALTLCTTMLVPAIQADAYVIHYSVTGGTGDRWSGVFDVKDMTVAGNDFTNINSITAYKTDVNGVITVTFPTMSTITSSYTNGTDAVWNEIIGGSFNRSFDIGSSSLAALLGSGATWYQITGSAAQSKTYIVDEIYGGVLYENNFGDPADTYRLNNLGIEGPPVGYGQVTFYVTPEPGTMMLLGSGVLTFGLSRFRRRKQEVGT